MIWSRYLAECNGSSLQALHPFRDPNIWTSWRALQNNPEDRATNPPVSEAISVGSQVLPVNSSLEKFIMSDSGNIGTLASSSQHLVISACI